ncbi:MAG: ATP-binding protein [Solirubrobacteraceae bacterium]
MTSESPTSESPTVRLGLSSRPQTLTIVRGMLAGVAEPLGFDAELLDDLKTAISEACNNVVLHAYGGGAGPMDVGLFVSERHIRVVVEDRGSGAPANAESAGGIGLSVIRALTETMTLEPGPDGGTRLEMTFAARRDGQPLFTPPPAAVPVHGWAAAEEDAVVVSLSPVMLLAPVLGRLARTLAAIAHFSLDRFSDVYLITDTLAAHAATAAADERVNARLAAAERRVDLAVGPFRPGASGHLDARSSEVGRPPLTLLSDEISVQPSGDVECLRVVIVDRRS